jgi:hypothetical protein
MFVAFVLVMLGVLLERANAAESAWQPPEFRCIPTVSDYDHAYRIRDAVAALVFWCDLTDGLHTYWVAGALPGGVTPKTQAEALRQIAGKDPAELLRRFVVRESTPSEMELVAEIEIAHAPRCYVIGTSITAGVLTANAQGTISTAKLDAQGVGIRVAVGAPVACEERLAKETLKRYCKADNLTDTKGRRVGEGGYIACKIERAPADGWPK